MRHPWALRFSSFGSYNHYYYFFSEMIEKYRNFSTHKLNMLAAKVQKQECCWLEGPCTSDISINTW